MGDPSRDVVRRALDRRLVELRKVQIAAIEDIRRLYPAGSRVGVFLRHGQIRPSAAEVLTHQVELCYFGESAFAYVRVRLLDCDNFVRNVHIDKVVLED